MPRDLDPCRANADGSERPGRGQGARGTAMRGAAGMEPMNSEARTPSPGSPPTPDAQRRPRERRRRVAPPTIDLSVATSPRDRAARA
jgi:hypothetical protein